MSAQTTLYNRYRPTVWSEIVEQDAIKQILSEELNSNTLKHVLLFTGPAGCGKTTSGRIFANTVEPTKGNIIEINCADHTGVDDVRQLVLDVSRTKPLAGTYKVFILDECFTGDTLIATPNGNIPIKNINVGDVVYNARGISKVIGVSIKRIAQKRIIQIRVNGKWITTTREHLFFTEKGWVKAKDLTVGCCLYSLTSIMENDKSVDDIETYIKKNIKPTEIVEDIDFEYINNFVETMYDLQIEGHPSYFVNNILVHNCHMLTTQSQNALLKIFEEPPAHCIYILCTTDPQKVLPTILSRSFRYDFQLISTAGIMSRLNYVLEQEKNLGEKGCGVQGWEPSAIELIAQSCGGHMRDALSTLEKVISYSKNFTVNDVTAVLGVTNYNTLFDILDSILNKNEPMLLSQLEQLNSSGMDLKLFIKNFLQFVLDINKYVILKTETGTGSITTIPPSFDNRLQAYNVSHRPILKGLLKTLLELNSSIRWETNVKPVLETNLLLEVL